MTAASRTSKTGSSWGWFERLRNVKSKHREWGWGYFFIAPMLILYTMFSVWPVIRGFMLSFMDYVWLYPETAHFTGLDNFVELTQDPMFWDCLKRTLYFLVLFMPTTILLSLIIATLIASVKEPILESFFRVSIYLPVILPVAVAMLLWRHVFNESFGWINLTLNRVIGIPFNSLPHWLSNPGWTMPVTVAAVAWKFLGQNVMFFLIGLYNINPELHEAAAIDGASAFQRWRYVTIPLLRPVFVIALVLSANFIGVTQEPMIMWADRHTPGGGPSDAAYTLGLYSYNIAFLLGNLRWGYAAAVSLVAGVIGMIIAAFVFRSLRSEAA